VEKTNTQKLSCVVTFFEKVSASSNVYTNILFLAGMAREGQLNGSSAAHGEIRGILFPILSVIL
jgi:hypothetical protein